ncbi:type II toxin-antitoxin system death-on-curing family toxin [Gordonia neofelifaecis]|uniref:Death-on-curing protein n=1 Tax=Gordonia neofelifaecis NRRL B-59395 TaxID=644548 RepID=F1YK89_9ACTN|nr:Fic family protein [Gordonia neofelifaecis]EGD54935.1 death-on-curing protein [Gordonia neofelifaecis NRRL B-59395]
MIWCPEIADIFLVYRAVYGADPEVRDGGLLQSSIQRPAVTLFGEEQYPTLHRKAAALFDSLCRNHALVDGNKRCAWIAVRLIYFRNAGHRWLLGDDAAYDLVIRACSEHVALDDLEAALRRGFG